MGKNIIITAGPTNERIDAVMKITNMSTGALGATIADGFLTTYTGKEIDNIFYIATKMSYKPRYQNDDFKPYLHFIPVESTADLINALEKIFSEYHIDIIIHSAAVGDYAGKYVIRAEDLIQEIIETIHSTDDKNQITEDLLMNIFENPKAICNNETKISSYEPHLMTMLTLTPKVIGKIKKMAPHVKLVGFKLLEGVSKEELHEVAYKLKEKNNADYIVANDLSKIGGGKHWAMIIGANGIETECNTKKEIAEALIKILL